MKEVTLKINVDKHPDRDALYLCKVTIDTLAVLTERMHAQTEDNPFRGVSKNVLMRHKMIMEDAMSQIQTLSNAVCIGRHLDMPLDEVYEEMQEDEICDNLREARWISQDKE